MRILPDPSKRTTVDLVMLGITAMVGFVIVGGTIGIIVMELAHPEIDTTPMVEVEGEILGVLVGALVGFVSGRVSGFELGRDAERRLASPEPPDPEKGGDQ